MQSFETITEGILYYTPGMLDTICWNDLNASAVDAVDTIEYPIYYGNENYSTDGNLSLEMITDSTKPLYLIMPSFHNAQHCKVEFDYLFESDESSTRRKMGYITDADDESTFVAVDSMDAASSLVEWFRSLIGSNVGQPIESINSNQVFENLIGLGILPRELLPHTSYLSNVPSGARVAFCFTTDEAEARAMLDNIRVDTLSTFTLSTAVNVPDFGTVSLSCQPSDTTASGLFYEGTQPMLTVNRQYGLHFHRLEQWRYQPYVHLYGGRP